MEKISKARETKVKEVAEIKQRLSSSSSAVLIDYRGLTVAEATQLRRQLNEVGVGYKVYKNTLIEIAATELGLQGLIPYLSGPTAIAFAGEDATAPARLLTESIKKFNKMKIKVGVLEHKVIDAEDVKILANLPSKQELIAKLLGTMNAPVVSLVSVLSGPARALVYALSAIKDKKEAS